MEKTNLIVSIMKPKYSPVCFKSHSDLEFHRQPEFLRSFLTMSRYFLQSVLLGAAIMPSSIYILAVMPKDLHLVTKGLKYK